MKATRKDAWMEIPPQIWVRLGDGQHWAHTRMRMEERTHALVVLPMITPHRM